MGYFKAYDKDDEAEFTKGEKKVTTLDYYEHIIKESLEPEKKLLEESLSNTLEKLNNKVHKEYLSSFWGSLEEDIICYRIVNTESSLDFLINAISDKELSYTWGVGEDKSYKIISIFNIYDQFFVKYLDNSKKTFGKIEGKFWWNIDKENTNEIKNELEKAQNELEEAKKDKEKKILEKKVSEAEKKVNRLVQKSKLTPDTFPPIFLFEDEKDIYFMINTKAPLLYFNINDHNKSQVSYYFNEENKKIKYRSTVKIKLTKSSGGYIGRPDSMDEIDYRWSMNSSLSEEERNIAKLLAFYIGLDDEKKVEINDQNELEYKETVDAKEEIYYKTNTPTSYSELKSVNTLKTFFNFYKLFKTDIIKKNFPKENIRKPLIFNNAEKTQRDKDNIEIENIYVLDSHKILYKSKNKGKEISSNPNARLSPAQVMASTLRDFSFFKTDEKTKAIIQPSYIDDKLPNKAELTYSNFSATSFAQYVLYEDTLANTTWQDLYFNENKKNASYLKSPNSNISKVDTNQEWCHLLGHADGGADEFGNLVSGSKHCNTEQLAMEIGQSRFIKDTNETINANITAYLIKSKITIRNESYSREDLMKLLGFSNLNKFDKFMEKDIFKKLFEEIKETDDKYKYKIVESDNYKDNLLSIYNARKQKINNIQKLSPEEQEEQKEMKIFEENLLKNFFEILPLAQNMRYKHYYKDKKVFDHIFDAQNESISSLECKILDYTLEMNLYIGTGDWNGYKKVLENRVKKKLPSNKTLKEDENIISTVENSKVANLNQKRKAEEFSSEIKEEIQKKVHINIENNVSKEEIKEINKKKEYVHIKNTLSIFSKIEEEK